MDKGILTNADIKQPKYKVLYGIMFAFIILYTAVIFFPVL